jgi:glycosyltransferase involved in cell wall biosynthesis
MIAPGRRRALVPLAVFGGKPLTLGHRDIVFNAGSGWSSIDIHSVRRRKERERFKFALLCYDIIPLLFPQFYMQHDVDEFRRYFEVAFPLADLVIFNSRRVAEDARAYATAQGYALGATRICPLGANATQLRAHTAAPPPSGLAPDRYALFVSTIEPRKGHRLLYNVWKRLLADGVPQRHAFKLVFLGRPGWLVDDLLRSLRTDPALGESLQLLSFADDATLAGLYENAAFCLYPSMYEGYGLPIVEAFSYGKAVLASTGGSIPEVSGELSPCLDPGDEAVWYQAMRRWIEDPAARGVYEKTIRERFHHPGWDEAAAGIFAAIDQEFRAG